MNKCPTHNRELKEFTAGPKAKNPGMKYWKCTAKVGNGWCNYVDWGNSEMTKVFKQMPDGSVLESEAPWPSEGGNDEFQIKVLAKLAEIRNIVSAINRREISKELGDHE